MKSNMKKNILWLIVMLVLTAGNVFAQKWYGIVNYQMATPLGDTKEYTNEFSFRGWGLEFRKTVSPGVTAGIAFGWNVFYERTNELIRLGGDTDGAIYGLQDRYINALSFMLNSHKYFGNRDGGFFAGINAGGAYMLQRLAIGIYEFDNNQWQWGAAPEVGFRFLLKGNSVLILNAKYYYYFNGELANGLDVNHQFISFGIGFAWRQY